MVGTDRVIADALAYACATSPRTSAATSRDPRGELPDDLDVIVLDATGTAVAVGWTALGRTSARLIVVGDLIVDIPTGLQIDAWVAADATTDQLIDAVTGGGSATAPSARLTSNELLAALTFREREILTELASGDPLPAIAERLAISEHTVRTHIQNVLVKLHVNSRAEAAALAIRHGLTSHSSTKASA